MDTAQYREAIKQIIQRHARRRPSHGDIRLDVVFDETNDRYALMQCGWDRGRRVRGNLIYIVIEDEKIIIEYDGIEQGISDDLIEVGVLEADIVLAFFEGPNVADSEVTLKTVSGLGVLAGVELDNNAALLNSMEQN